MTILEVELLDGKVLGVPDNDSEKNAAGDGLMLAETLDL